MRLIFFLIISVFASEKENINENSELNNLKNAEQNEIFVKIEEDENIKKSSIYFGVNYQKQTKTWRVQRWSKKDRKHVFNGCSYRDEQTAAHASDTLARKLMANGEKGHKLNFPDDETEVNAKKKDSNFVGVSYHKQKEKWHAQRRSKNENKVVHNGAYKDEEKAAHASDTLARKLMASGEKGHKLNFPDDDTEVYPKKKTSIFVGVTYNKNSAKWCAQRWNKNENKMVNNGTYKDEEAAAHASDTVARKLMANGDKGHQLNFPHNESEVCPEIQNNKRKRSSDSNNSQKYKPSLDKFE